MVVATDVTDQAGQGSTGGERPRRRRKVPRVGRSPHTLMLTHRPKGMTHARSGRCPLALLRPLEGRTPGYCGAHTDALDCWANIGAATPGEKAFIDTVARTRDQRIRKTTFPTTAL
jgi:hypothetical protein